MEEVPLLKALQTKYADRATIIGISIDESLERVDKTIKDKKMTWPILAESPVRCAMTMKKAMPRPVPNSTVAPIT